MRTRSFVFLGIAVATILFLAAEYAISQEEPKTPKTGNIVGTVKFVGEVPAPKKIEVTKDKQVCGEEKESEELVVGPAPEQGIRWAVVYLKTDEAILPAELQDVTRELDQKGCQFQPHVLLVPAGGRVDVLNPDGIFHNFHTHSELNKPINKAQPKFLKKMKVGPFEKPEIFRVGCDVHDAWMKAWIAVSEHSFYKITDEKGEFRLEGVPVGKRTLKVWHEKLGEQEIEVEAKEGEDTKVVIEMKEEKK